jgi:hypothetical protein
MALSMDEQRMLAEIERRLSAEDPGLAAKLSSFKRPGAASRLRSPRSKLIGSLFTVVLLAVISMMVYAMVPFRAHGAKSGSSPQASSPGFSTSAQMRPQPGSPAAQPSARTTTVASGRGAASTITPPKIGAAKTAGRTGPGAGKVSASGGTKTARAAHTAAG